MPSEGDKVNAEVEAKAKADVEAGAKKVDLEGLTPAQQKQVFGYLLQQNETLRREMVVMGERLGKAAASEPASKPARKAEDEVELETMSRAQFAKHILSSVKEDVAKPLLERISETETGSERMKAEVELRNTIKENPDFWEFQDETKGILERHPALTVSEALILARSQAPGKVKLLEEKRAKEEGEGNVRKINERKASFGGLFPTSGKTATVQKMNIKDAAESAWESSGASEHLAAIGE